MSTALRKLAIRLACVHSEDRDWILGQLTPSERQRIEDLLHEIGLLGLAADPAIVEAVMTDLDESSAAVQPHGLLDSDAHPYWLGLALQSLNVETRRQYLEVGTAGKPELLKWHKTFNESVLPPALLRSLQAHLETRGKEHEHN